MVAGDIRKHIVSGFIRTHAYASGRGPLELSMAPPSAPAKNLLHHLSGHQLCGPGLAQRRARGPSADGGRAGRLCGAADRRPRGDVPLRDPRQPEGPHPGTGGPGGGASGARPLCARHRGRVQGRERAVIAVADGGLGDRRAAVGGLPGVRRPRSVGVRHRLPVRGRHRRAHPPWPEARAGAGGLGFTATAPRRCCT